MKLTILGMNGPYPAPGGCCSGYLVQSGGTNLQLDLGCGTLPALLARVPLTELTALVISHWHGDHCSDVLPLLYALESAVAAHRREPLPVFGVDGGASPVFTAVKACTAVALRVVEPGETIRVGDFTIATLAARHPVRAMMLRLTQGGKTLCYTGDTNTQPCLTAYAQGADLLLCDGLFPESVWSEEKPHLSAAHCARLARDAGVKRLIITHLNPDIDARKLLQEASAIYPDAELARCGMTAEL